MQRVESSFASVTGEPLQQLTWLPEGQPVGIIQLVHGMAEHISRYEGPAAAFAKAGYVVVGHNHLGHGEGAPIKGYFGQKDGWQHLIDDVHALRLRTEQAWPGLPYFLLGHSMGSFVVRCYLTEHGEGLTGAILSGTGYYAPATVNSGLLLARRICAHGRSKKPSPLIDRIGFSANNRPFAPNRTAYDWLSRDEAEVDKYVADPLCGFVFTAGGYKDLFTGLKRLNQLEELRRIPKNLPVLFISGQRDPVGGMGEGVGTVAEQFRNAGIERVQVKLYPECRHELFNELNREEVYQDVIRWMDSARK